MQVKMSEQAEAEEEEEEERKVKKMKESKEISDRWERVTHEHPYKRINWLSLVICDAITHRANLAWVFFFFFFFSLLSSWVSLASPDFHQFHSPSPGRESKHAWGELKRTFVHSIHVVASTSLTFSIFCPVFIFSPVFSFHLRCPSTIATEAAMRGKKEKENDKSSKTKEFTRSGGKS